MFETDRQQIDRLSEELAIIYMRNMEYKDTPALFAQKFLEAKKEILEYLTTNHQ